MGFMHRVKVMLGLADEYDDEQFEDEYHEEEYEDDDQDYTPVRREAAYPSPYGSDSTPLSVRRVDRQPDIARAREAAPLRAVPSPVDLGSAPQVKIHTVEPRSYSEAQSIADKFKVGQPVIMNLTMTDADLAKRLIDFASGLTYGLDGGLQKVSDKVFMLTPHNVDVSAAASAARRTPGLFGE
ncbi:MAG: cell division protein SepF [Coriobacteriia bacterium]|nr:cell division protein SepF [Coriobacteriia bacterium]